MHLKGMGIYPDIAFGKGVIYHFENLEALKNRALKRNLTLEVFEKSIEEAKKDLENLYNTLEGTEGLAEIIEFQMMLLEDDDFYGAMKEKIEKGVHPAQAVYDVVSAVIDQFKRSKSVYMRERVADIVDLGIRIIKKMLGEKEFEIPKGAIVVSEELTPSDVTRLAGRIAGIVTERGSALSHFAIIARELGIPTVVGAKGVLNFVSDGDVLVINGITGTVIISPTEEELKRLKRIKEQWKTKLNEILGRAKEEARTKDGTRIVVVANVGNQDEIALARYNGAEGIGLFRTEFFFLYSDAPPEEEEQYNVYKFAADQMNPGWVYIRTLDIGSDKQLPYLELPQEPNPALGMRAVRLYKTILNELIKKQIRAILRASVSGKVGIMVPMIADLSEIRMMKSLIEELKRELEKEGKKVGEFRFGIMVETPAAALLSDKFGKEIDFMSIGTNDLTQYTLAADRAGREVPSFFSHLHPAILRMIKIIVKNANKTNTDLSVCGESASDIFAIPILIGLGIRKLSASPTLIPLIKHLIRQLNLKDLEKLVEKALNLDGPDAVRELVSDFYRKEGIDIPIL